MELNYLLIGARIKKLRKLRKMTQDKLSELAEISPQHMSQIESGKTKLSLQTLVSICNALEVTTDKILCDVVAAEKTEINSDIAEVFNGCTDEETDLMLSVAEKIKQTLRSRKFRITRE